MTTENIRRSLLPAALVLLLAACEQQSVAIVPPNIEATAFTLLSPDAGVPLAEAYSRWQTMATETEPGPAQYDAAMRFAELAFAWERFIWAEESLQRACASPRSDARCWYLLALSQQTNSNDTAAAASFEQALQRQPTYLPIRLQLGEYLLATGQLSAAAQRLGKRQAGESAALLGLRGRIALAAGDNPAALEQLEAALKLEPEASRLRYPYGLALRAAGREQDALQALARNGPVAAQVDDPLLSEVQALAMGVDILRYRGNDLALAGQYAEAAAAYRQALEQEEDALTRLNLGIALARSNQPAAAEAEFRQALQADPGLPAGWFGLGTLLAAQGRHEEAVAAYLQALQQHPGDLDARYNLANAQRRLGQPDQATENYRLVTNADPARIEAQIALAQILSEQQLWSAALEVLRTGLQSHPQDGRLALQLARLLAAAPDSAIRDGATALRLAEQLFSREQSLAHGETLAMALAEVGRFQQAAELQQSLIDAVRAQGRDELMPALQAALEDYAAERPYRLE
ncbi:MAG: tetratricopeptide repeat protein [Xanthomonadales bacterium]|nr:tetratricopeptide repeat protein [Xanthomonadales bacterium]